MKKIYNLLLLAALVAGCSSPDKPDGPVVGTLNLSVDTVTLSDQEPYRSQITIVSNAKWEAEKADGAQWFEIAPISGPSGTTTLEVSVSQSNPDYIDRSSAIVVKSGNLSQRLVVVQKKKNAILLSQQRYEVNYNGGRIDIKVKANLPYTVSMPKDVDWIERVKTKSLRESQESFVVGFNTANYQKSRMAKIVFENRGSLTSDTLTVVQVGVSKSTYYVEIAGMLDMLFNQSKMDTMTSLKLLGKLNAADFETMYRSMPRLSYLDLSEVTVEGNTIPFNAFYSKELGGKVSLNRVILPENLVSIGDMAFRDCLGLSGELVIPSGVTTINRAAFESCHGLSGTLDIPSSVSHLGELAFSNCNGFTDVRVHWDTPIPYKEQMIPDNKTVYAPTAAVNTYKLTPGWAAHDFLSY